MERRDNPFGSLDIEESRIPELLRRWEYLDPGKFMDSIIKKPIPEDAYFIKYILQKGKTFGKHTSPEDGESAELIGALYCLSAFYINEVMNSIPGLRYKPTQEAVQSWENHINKAQNDPYDAGFSMIAKISPNLDNLARRLESEAENGNDQLAIATALVDIYFIKFRARSVG